jgi:hypothetical protein
MPSYRLNAGSLILDIASKRSFYPDALAELLCAASPPVAKNSSRPDAEIVFTESEDFPRRPAVPKVFVPEDGMVIVDSPSAPEVHTETLSVRLLRDRTPARILVSVFNPKMAERDLKVHLSVVLFKVLFLLDRLMLHAAAVDFRGSVGIFLGGKGAGKSTTCLSLARAGGTILAEDRVILKKAGSGFFVSGCGERSRITAKTERHFFSAPLPLEPIDVEGVLKKQFPAGLFFSSMPYRDYPAERIFFNHVGARFRITKLSKGEALINLLRETQAWHRFAGAEDHRRHLRFLRACVEALPAFRLELSPDLGEMEKLAAFLGAPL